MKECLESQTTVDVMTKIAQLYGELMNHDGYGDIRIEMRILRRQQKEVIVHCGKQYRFIVDYKKSDDVVCDAVSAMNTIVNSTVLPVSSVSTKV